MGGVAASVDLPMTAMTARASVWTLPGVQHDAGARNQRATQVSPEQTAWRKQAAQREAAAAHANEVSEVVAVTSGTSDGGSLLATRAR